MDDTTVTITLPSDLVRRATEEGLLTSERVSEWLADELKRSQASNRLFANLDKLRAAASDLTPEDLDAELNAESNLAITVQHFNEPSELLGYLRLSASHWAKVQHIPKEFYSESEWDRTWLFRGQAQNRPLTPSAWRLSGKATLRKSLRQAWDQSGDYWGKVTTRSRQSEIEAKFGIDAETADRIGQVISQALFEFTVVANFLQRADALGHRVPSLDKYRIPDDFALYYLDLLLNDRTYDLWLDAGVALAQHHGIPTRLLDWSHNPLVAAFFAAENVVKEGYSSGTLVIYAAPSELSNFGSTKVINHPKSDNPFMLAQRGVFTYDTHCDEYFIKNGQYPDFLSSLSEHPLLRYQNSLSPRIISLDVKCAPELLRLLALEGISRAHLMPTLDNIVDTFKLEWNLAYDK